MNCLPSLTISSPSSLFSMQFLNFLTEQFKSKLSCVMFEGTLTFEKFKISEKMVYKEGKFVKEGGQLFVTTLQLRPYPRQDLWKQCLSVGIVLDKWFKNFTVPDSYCNILAQLKQHSELFLPHVHFFVVVILVTTFREVRIEKGNLIGHP